MNRLIALGAAGIGMALAHSRDISIGYGDDDVGPKPRKHKATAQPIAEIRTPPKEKSASLRRMLKSKGRK